MSDEGIPMVRRHAAVIVACAIALFVAILVLRGVAGMMAERKRNQVLGAWAETLGSFEEILESHPEREANEVARRVEELAAELGIDIVPSRVEGRARPDEDSQRAYRDARLPIGSYLLRRLQSAGPVAGPPPAEVVAFIERHEDTLDPLKQLLARGDPPLWQLRLEKPFETPFPNSRGHVDLQRLLLVDGLIRNDRGDATGALAALEASWRLNAGLRDEPDLVAQGTALNVARMQLAAMRHLDSLPDSWRRRILEHDYRRSFLIALRYDGWIWLALHDLSDQDPPDSPWGKLVLRLTGPYMGYSVADVSDRWRRLLIRFSETEALCDADPAEAGFDPTIHVPSWNLVGQLTNNDLRDTFRRLARYDLDLEMTAKLLEIRSDYEAGNSTWPERLPGDDRSAACPGERWIYRVSPAGEMSLALSRALEWGSLSGVALPTQYVAPARVR